MLKQTKDKMEKPIILTLESSFEAETATFNALKDEFRSILGGPCPLWQVSSALCYLSGAYTRNFPIDIVYVGCPSPFKEYSEMGITTWEPSEFTDHLSHYLFKKSGRFNPQRVREDRTFRLPRGDDWDTNLVGAIGMTLHDKGIPLVISTETFDQRNWEKEKEKLREKIRRYT